MTERGSELEVRLLGPVELIRAGRGVPLGGGRARALVAVLALRAGEVVSSDRLIDELWGERPPETAATALHGLVSQLRKAFGEDRGHPSILVTRAPGYVLVVAPEAIDAARFERLTADGDRALEQGHVDQARRKYAEASALWRGPALDGVSDRPLVHAEAQRLEELRLHAQEGRIEADLRRGRGGAVVGELETLVSREPLRERPRAQLMRALYADGRQADALAVYRDGRSRLHEELGIEPGPELRELERQILEQDPGLAAPPTAPALASRRSHRRRLVLGLTLVAVLVAAVSATVLLLRGGAEEQVVVRANSVAVLDPVSARIVDEIPVGARPTAVVVGHGSVWVANTDDGTVMQIDPQTRTVVRSVGVGLPVSSLAVTEDAVWTGNGSAGSVSRIGLGAGSGVDTFDVDPGDDLVRQPVSDVAAGLGSVWVAVGSELLRLDPRTGRRLARIELDSVPLAVATGEGAVWAATVDERLLRIEPATRLVAASADINSPVDLAAGLGRVWLVTTNAELAVYDPLLSPLELTRLGRVFPSAVEPGDGAVWVAELRADGANRVVRLDADQPGRVTAFAPVGPDPVAIALGEGSVWVTVRRSGP